MQHSSLVFLLFLLFSSCSSNKKEKVILNQKVAIVDNKQSQKQQLYISLGDFGSDMEKFANENHLQRVRFIDEKMFLTKTLYQVDEEKMISNINKIYPDVNQKGVCYINLEAPHLDQLISNSSDDLSFKKSLAVFLKVIKTAKKTRPNVKWGFYAIPFTTYWETMTGFLDRNDKIDELLKEVDVFFPSLYMFYDDGIVGTLKNSEYISSNIQKSIELGKKYDKPVYPFVLHRFHPSNEKLGWSQMDNSFWKDYIHKIVSCQQDKKYVDGIVWWAADSYFYGRKDGMNINKEFKGSKNDFINYNDKIYIEKAKIVQSLLNQ